jgi:hypothetical protein
MDMVVDKYHLAQGSCFLAQAIVLWIPIMDKEPHSAQDALFKV